MICSSLNLLFFLSVILHDLTDFSTSNWYAGRGAGRMSELARDCPGDSGQLIASKLAPTQGYMNATCN